VGLAWIGMARASAVRRQSFSVGWGCGLQVHPRGMPVPARRQPVGRRPRKRVGYLYLPPDTDPPAPEGVGGLGPRLVKKKILQNFSDFSSYRISRRMHGVLNIDENKN